MKNIFKRIICLCLVGALCAGFAGCRKNPGTEGSISELSSSDVVLGDVELDENSSEEGTESDTTSDGSQTNNNNNQTNNNNNNNNNQTNNNNNNTNNNQNQTGNNNDSGVTNADVELPVKDMKGRTFTFAAPSWDDTVNVDADWVKALEKKYNCKFKNLNLNNDYTTLYSSILAGNPIADVVVFNYTNFYPAVKENLLLELKSSENINYQDSECFIPKAQEKLTTVNGKLYGAIDTYAFRNLLVYNRSIIKGEDDLLTLYNNGKLTWDKLYEILQKVVASGKQGIAGEMNEEGILQSFILANGSTWFKRDGGLNFTYCLDNQNTRDALSYVQKLKASNLTMPLDGGNYLYGQTQFAKGRVSMMIVDGYNLDYIAKNAKFDYGVVMLPNKDGSKGLVDLTEFECYSIPRTVNNPDDVQLIFAAWKQAEEANNEGKQWSLENKTDDLDTKDAAIIKEYAKRIENADGIIDYRNVLVDYYGDDINTQEKKCLYSEITVQAYLERVGQIYIKGANDFNK